MSETLVLRLRLRPGWSQGRSQVLRPPAKSLSISLKISDSFSKISVSVGNFEVITIPISHNDITSFTDFNIGTTGGVATSCQSGNQLATALVATNSDICPPSPLFFFPVYISHRLHGLIKINI